MGARPSAFEQLERLSRGRTALVLAAAWGAAEAIFLPVVPDVLLCLCVLALPRRVGTLLGAAFVGALAGTLILHAYALAAPEAARTLVLGVPGISAAMLGQAQAQLAAGDPVAMAQFGPGTPLKVYTLAWTAGAGSLVGLLAGTVLNRLTRVAPDVVLAAVVGAVAPGFLRRHERLVLAIYAAIWIAVYALYLG